MTVTVVATVTIAIPTPTTTKLKNRQPRLRFCRARLIFLSNFVYRKDMVIIIKRKNTIITVSVLLIIAAVGAVLATTGVSEDFEQEIARFINPDRSANAVMKFFTNLGKAPGVIGVTAAFLLIPPTRRRVGAPLAVTVTSSWLTCTALKNIIRRVRPVLKVIPQGGYSFPSGHAMNSAALYIGIMLLLLPMCKNRGQKAAVICICSFLTFIIGFSRVYFNVHFTSDVVSGWCLGIGFAASAAQIYSDIEKNRSTGIKNDRD